VTVGARYVDDDALDPSKLDEYRSLGTGASLWGGFEFRGRSDQGYFNAYGENLGLDNQYLDVRGGAFGVFKYRLYSDEMVHNFGSGPGALSPFTGMGTNTLRATLPNPNVATWNTFDHSYTRRDQGGFVEWQKTSPWYVRFDANEVRREGINVFAGANGTSPGNGFTDLPSPIDYTTTNISGEFGYSGDRSHFAVNLLHSSFSNANPVLRWNNGFFTNGLDTTVLPQDNELTRIAVNGNMRGLFWNSTLAGRLVYSQLTSDVTMQDPFLAAAGPTFDSPGANPARFEGDVKRTNLSLSLSSHPTQALDTRAYVDYAKEENDSTHMTFSPTTNLDGGTCVAGGPCNPELFHYEKTKLGLEGHYRLSRENKLSGGFEYADTERERIDFDKTEETKLYVQWKNSSFDWLTSRVKYQYLTRKSDFNANIVQFSDNPMDFYVRRFDLANVDQNLVKLIFDLTPAPFFDIGLEAILKRNDYKDTILGRTEDERQEYYASVAYGDPSRLRFLVFGDIELTSFDSFHRADSSGSGNPDPSTPPVAATYNWSATNDDEAWQLGAGLDWQATASLMIKGSLVYAKTEGSTEFSAQIGSPFPINNVDNTKRTTFNLKGVYAYDRNWELTGGYAYEKYEYDDIGYTGTRYVTSATNTAGVVTGQYSFQPYKANIIYGMAKYKF
jgi:MtrB/PioB family decaheme-associated outer membrane protein